MGTLKRAKKNLTAAAKKIQHVNILRGTVREILVDLDGDKLADVGLIDTTGDGNIDMLALDLNGDNEFNLYFADTDGSGRPDITFLDEKSDGNLKLVGIRDYMQDDMTQKAAAVYSVLTDKEASEDILVSALGELCDVVAEARIAYR